MKLVEGFAAELGRSESFHRGGERLSALRRVEARQREMGMKIALFGGNAQRFELRFDRAGQRGELRIGFDARPKNARAARAGEEAQPGEAQHDGGKRGEAAERLANLFDRLQRNFADEFEGDVHALEAHPSRAQTGFLRAARSIRPAPREPARERRARRRGARLYPAP